MIVDKLEVRKNRKPRSFAIRLLRKLWKYTLVKILLLGIVLGGLLFGYTFVEPYRIKIKYISLIDPDIPAAFAGTKIVFVSDIHHGPNFYLKRLHNLVSTLNELQADIVVFGGDYYQWGREYVLPCFQELTRVKASIGKFGVLGNHDYGNHDCCQDFAVLARQGMKKARIIELDNRAEWIPKADSQIKIGGVGDLLHATQDITPTIHDVSENDFVILVSHNPEYVEQITTPMIDVVLSGHTHGGQITFFGLWAPFMELEYGKKYLTGIVETEQTKVIISNGVGMVAVPMRFWARPDIIVLTMRKT